MLQDETQKVEGEYNSTLFHKKNQNSKPTITWWSSRFHLLEVALTTCHRRTESYNYQVMGKVATGDSFKGVEIPFEQCNHFPFDRVWLVGSRIWIGSQAFRKMNMKEEQQNFPTWNPIASMYGIFTDFSHKINYMYR